MFEIYWKNVQWKKVFVKYHLVYGEVIFGKAYKKALHQNIEYKACLALSGYIRGTSKGKLSKNWARSPFNVAVGKGIYLF